MWLKYCLLIGHNSYELLINFTKIFNRRTSICVKSTLFIFYRWHLQFLHSLVFDKVKLRHLIFGDSWRFLFFFFNLTLMIFQERIYWLVQSFPLFWFIKYSCFHARTLNLNFVTSSDHASKCRVNFLFFTRERQAVFFFFFFWSQTFSRRNATFWMK